MNRNATARPTRWIPAEVWQRQGMTAQVLTLPGGKRNVTAIIFLLPYTHISPYRCI